ncbi:MAG TPA: RpiB/LacA/LacB family sugar-phosphate isomerase [bacterium]|nr:RpiB/LacA/LacB family sugar-phosphate isomerase [bacterium]
MIYLASDHAGFELKEKLKTFLGGLGYEVEDLGPFSYDEKDDYPDFVLPLARKVAESAAADSANFARGIVIGGSGQGEAMAANRIKGVRAAVYYGPSGETPGFKGKSAAADDGSKPGVGEGERIIKLSREHNDANVLSLGARFLDEDEAKDAVKLWLKTPFSGEERHRRRISKLDNF